MVVELVVEHGGGRTHRWSNYPGGRTVVEHFSASLVKVDHQFDHHSSTTDRPPVRPPRSSTTSSTTKHACASFAFFFIVSILSMTVLQPVYLSDFPLAWQEVLERVGRAPAPGRRPDCGV